MIQEAAQSKTSSCHNVGRAIRFLRKRLQMSQEVLAERAGLARSTVICLENGRYGTVSLESLECVASAFGVPLKELLSHKGDEEMFPVKKGREGDGEFRLDYPETGLRIVSWLPHRRDFFLGCFQIEPKREITNGVLPHAALVFFEILAGRLLVTFPEREVVLKEKEYLFFNGNLDYRLYNPDALLDLKAVVTTFPSFL